jgi:hypothetical protein
MNLQPVQGGRRRRAARPSCAARPGSTGCRAARPAPLRRRTCAHARGRCLIRLLHGCSGQASCAQRQRSASAPGAGYTAGTLLDLRLTGIYTRRWHQTLEHAGDLHCTSRVAGLQEDRHLGMPALERCSPCGRPSQCGASLSRGIPALLAPASSSIRSQPFLVRCMQTGAAHGAVSSCMGTGFARRQKRDQLWREHQTCQQVP